jgi:hypothetical protein
MAQGFEFGAIAKNEPMAFDTRNVLFALLIGYTIRCYVIGA